MAWWACRLAIRYREGLSGSVGTEIDCQSGKYRNEEEEVGMRTFLLLLKHKTQLF